MITDSVCYHYSQSSNQRLYPMSYSSLMATHGATPNQGPARPSETSSLHSHCHVFRDLRHRAIFKQPSSRQPVTTTMTQFTVPKYAWVALTHPSHYAVAHQGHDEPPNTHSFVSATPTRATQRLQIENLFQQASYWDTDLPKGT